MSSISTQLDSQKVHQTKPERSWTKQIYESNCQLLILIRILGKFDGILFLEGNIVSW